MNRIIAIVLGGLAAGVLDILYAFIVYGPLSYNLSPMRVLQSVAAGWIGRDASRAGDWGTAMLGLGSHFLIATLMAAAFVIAAGAFKMLTRNAVLWGLVYGLLLYVAMNYVVVPLSAAGEYGAFPHSFEEVMMRLQAAFSEVRPPPSERFPWMLPGTIFTHVVLVGLPIALIAKRYTTD